MVQGERVEPGHMRIRSIRLANRPNSFNQKEYVEIIGALEPTPSFHDKHSMPKWRSFKPVGHQATLYTFLTNSPFTSIVNTTDKDQSNYLASVKLPEALCLIQAGVNDWHFLQQLAFQVGLLKEGMKNSYMFFTGGHDGFWRLAASSMEASRTLTLLKQPPELGNLKASNGISREFSSSVFSLPLMGNESLLRLSFEEMQFSPTPWRAWAAVNVPAALTLDGDEFFVWASEDTLSQFLGAEQRDITWERCVYCALKPRLIDHQNLVKPWFGWGKMKPVENKTSPFVDVEVTTPFEQGFNTIRCRLTSATVGKAGKNGLHIYPEPGTSVLIAWTGLYKEHPVVLGNIRENPSILPAPSCVLNDDSLQIQAPGTLAKFVELVVQSNKKIDISSEQPLTLTGDKQTRGISIRLASGSANIESE